MPDPGATDSHRALWRHHRSPINGSPCEACGSPHLKRQKAHRVCNPFPRRSRRHGGSCSVAGGGPPPTARAPAPQYLLSGAGEGTWFPNDSTHSGRSSPLIRILWCRITSRLHRRRQTWLSAFCPVKSQISSQRSLGRPSGSRAMGPAGREVDRQ